MTNIPPAMSEMHRKNMEAAMQLAQLSMESSQRMMELQTELAKRLFEQSVSNAKAQLEAKDPQALVGLRAQYAQETAQQMLEAGRRFAELGNEARVVFSRLLTEQLAAGSHEMTDVVQSLFKALPGGNNPMADAMSQAVQNATSAMEQMSQVTQSLLGGFADVASKATGGKKK